MSKGGIKVSGLIASGKLSLRPGIQAVASFGRADAEDPNELVPGREYMIRLDMLVDSPYQTRLTIDPTRVDDVSGQLEDQGQIDPIEFRDGKTPNTYEIIKGHTRKYAAVNIGWSEIRGLYKKLTDEEAEIACMVDNTGALPTEYEYAHMFKRALDKGYAKTQGAVGKMFGYSQGAVSKSLAMLELPEEIRTLLDNRPALFGAAAGRVIAGLWNEHADHRDIIIEVVKQIGDGLEQADITSHVEKRISELNRKTKSTLIKDEKPTKQKPRRESIKSPTGGECYVTILKEKAMVIEFKDLAIPAEKAQEVVNKALRQLAETLQAAENAN